MTVGAIVWTSLATLAIVIVGWGGIWALGFDRDWQGEFERKSDKVHVGRIVAIVLVCVIAIGAEWGGHIWYYQKTAKGQRAVKTQQSNFSNGIEREVKVYDVNGKLVAYYDGKFDITYDDDRILFDDENGKRHIVYYPTGTVVIDER